MIRIDERRSSLRAFAPVLALLAVSVLINYIDRGNLGIAAPLLKAELQISGSQLGVLLAAFFWTYTGLLFVVGWAPGVVSMILAGFRFAMNNSAAVCLFQSLADLDCSFQELLQRQRPFSQPLSQRLALETGHRRVLPDCGRVTPDKVGVNTTPESVTSRVVAYLETRKGGLVSPSGMVETPRLQAK
jgi:hypothetical protein